MKTADQQMVDRQMADQQMVDRQMADRQMVDQESEFVSVMEGCDGLMNDNFRKRDGFSLIELMIAIAILAIFVGITSLSIGLLRSTDSNGLANKINDSLTDLKSMTESYAGPFYLHIYKSDDGYFAQFNGEPIFSAPADNDKRLGSSSMRVAYIDDDSGDAKELDSSSLTITIQKKDGAYMDVSTSEEGGGTVIPVPRSIEVSKGEDEPVDYRVVLTKDTGLHFVEKVVA